VIDMAGGKRNQNQDLAACRLAAWGTLQEAATAAGVDERTITRWLAEDAPFKARVAELRQAMVSRACGELADTMSAAVKKLRELVDSKNENVAFRAANAVIEQTLKVTELVDLQRRVEELESRLAEKGKQ
jgi:hypothetical protein